MNCNVCNNAPKDCCNNECCNDKCCPMLDISETPDDISTVRFNINGLTAWYDYGNMIFQTQTDTKLSVDAIKRVLKFMAERHEDTISAKELGSILHIANIGDVDISEITDNSLFVYKKNNDCGHGCEGIDNKWIAWNAKDHTADSVDSVLGFDQKGAPKSLLPPANANQFHSISWNADKKIGYHQPQERSLKSIAVNEKGKNYAYQLFVDPKTKEPVYVKVEVDV